MNSKRIKEIQETTAYPDSVSVKQALLQVWNECEQECKKYSKEEVLMILKQYSDNCTEGNWSGSDFEWFEQFKKE